MTDNKQQTAMQEHIAWLKEQLQECIDEGYSESWISAYKLAIKHAELMLEEEKEKIGLAYYEGLMDSMNNTPRNYYEQTYGGGDK
jgi:hypothetical protein